MELLLKRYVMLRRDKAVLAVREAVLIFECLGSTLISLQSHDSRSELNSAVESFLVLVEVYDQLLRQVIDTGVP